MQTAVIHEPALIDRLCRKGISAIAAPDNKALDRRIRGVILRCYINNAESSGRCLYIDLTSYNYSVPQCNFS